MGAHITPVSLVPSSLQGEEAGAVSAGAGGTAAHRHRGASSCPSYQLRADRRGLLARPSLPVCGVTLLFPEKRSKGNGQ